MRYIFSSLIVEGVTLEQISHKSGEKILEKFKDVLIKEIEKYHSKGLRLIKITNLNTYNHDNLIVEFVSIVNPKYHQQISNAINRALLSVNVSLYFLQLFSFICIIFF